MKDHEILNLLKTKKTVGLELLYEKHGPTVYGIIERHASTDAITEQLLVDTFLTAWQQADKVDVAKTNLLSWLLHLTISTIQKQLKLGNIEKNALQPFPKLSTQPNLEKESNIVRRLERGIKQNSLSTVAPGGRVGEEKLHYSILALRARMQINETLFTK